MTVVVTGAAGFIGSNIIRALNAQGETDIIAVDNLTRGDKVVNLAGLEIVDYIDKEDFFALLSGNKLPTPFAILHQGACSDTMEANGRYIMENNYRYSVNLLEWCLEKRIPLLYASSASVYGSGTVFKEDRENERPLNAYAYSKFLFDQRVRKRLSASRSQIAGFRYFNVYGPGETHKGRMASVAFHHTHQYRTEGHVRLFGAWNGYAAGMQRRDFIHIDDVVAVNLWFLQNTQVSGIFNVGTGRAQSFNEVGETVVNTVRRLGGESVMSREELIKRGLLKYVDFPEALKGKYQSFTQADISALRAAGYNKPMLSVQEGVARYVETLVPAR